MKTNFWSENKVLILGLAGAVLMVVQQLTKGVDNIDWKVVSLAAGVAAAGYVGKNWRGQTNSIIGIVGNVGWSIYEVYTSGHFTWVQVAIQFGTLYLTLSAPDAKSRGYEHSELIVAAKKEGEIIQPAALTSAEIKKEIKEDAKAAL